MGRSQTSFARLRTELLDAREARDEVLQVELKAASGCVVFASVAIPGADKTPQGISELFQWMNTAICKALGPIERQITIVRDGLGPCTLFTVAHTPEQTKRSCIRLEELIPAARLIDLDVYAPDGHQLGRAALNLPPRSCLVCTDSATSCIRLNRHDRSSLDERVSQLLKHFLLASSFAGAGRRPADGTRSDAQTGPG